VSTLIQVAIMLYIRKVPGSDTSSRRPAIPIDVFRVSPQYLQKNSVIVPQIRLRQLPSLPFKIHYSLTKLSFDATYCGLLTVLSDKQNISSTKHFQKCSMRCHSTSLISSVYLHCTLDLRERPPKPIHLGEIQNSFWTAASTVCNGLGC
jgi:hypothetical protein